MTTTREQQRLSALHEYRLLDAPAGDELEAVVRVAATVAGVPNASLNLIDENRQCQLTTAGFAGGVTGRDDSMCAVRFESGEFTYLPDARLDPAFAANPWVTGALGDVRFYASAPLITPQGYALGSLCVFHDQVHELDAVQIARLRDLAQVVLGLFERRRQARVNAELAAELRAKQAALSAQQDQLEATVAELRRSNAELEQFAGVVSHDLAAPLSVVSGYLELLDEQAGHPEPEAVRFIAAARGAVGRMRTLITALLGYAQAGNAPCRVESADLGELVDLALTDLRPVADGAVVVVEPGLPTLGCDPVLVRQLLQNLVGNAFKYRDPARPLRVAVGASREAGAWRVTVADNGIGIPAAERDHVFAMFTRVDRRDGRGHGIGLSTCQRIVERHGGSIGASETPGGGTTIAFTLADGLG